ncbi:transposase [Stenotrophomonas maltophilia]|uniref:transposase n=1 Tax=Stenotrophomonas sp. RAC2 TaxID=3064902 RepID=UPI00130F91B9|nr:transposase [Stenotrophomonas sp. RAC2]MBH1432959.1 transposase [Stenotrophomonas maltophilia]MDV9040255.1 transposase [Stenotrophomonas sp. RAC2]
MAYSLQPSVQGTASVADLVSYCREHVRYGDHESILAASDMLAAVANDRGLLVRAINTTLLGRDDHFNNSMGVSSQAVLLYSDATYKIRANVWKKPVVRAGSLAHDSSLYSYNYAHNHNFELLTIGYLGSGYWTEIHECNPREIQGYIGEDVTLKFLEKTSLPRGKVMLYRACDDVHTQLPCEELSVSLNLIVGAPQGQLPDQYAFDVSNSRISGLITSNDTGTVSLLSFAALLGATEAFDSIERIAVGTGHWRLRMEAFKVACHLAPGERSRLWRRAEGDDEPMISQAARRWLAHG